MNERRRTWFSERGPIPKGWVVHNMNGNMRDNRLENLACIPRKTDNISQVIAPYRERIKKLEQKLEEK
jgi:hypothetical protein|tara:strand:- start:1741 stop:1944 length:204 start_codon:yes stop_codon:yes gene_type:complete